MDNPEIQTTLVTRKNEDNKTNNTTQRVKKMSNMGGGGETLEKTKRAIQHVRQNTIQKVKKVSNRGAHEVDINIHLSVRMPFLSVTYS